MLIARIASRGASAGLGGRSSRYLSTTSLANAAADDTPPPLPVGIFVDLDNIAQPTQTLSTHTREEAAKFASPLRRFAEAAGQLSAFRAYANKHTLRYVGDEEWERREHYIENEVARWDKDASISGFDDKGMLRCGVCGTRIKLTKKDVASGRDVWSKLDRHMRQLHDREQEKRRTRLNHKTKKGRKKPGRARLSEKEMAKLAKYEAAQIGLNRKPALRVKKKGGGPPPRTDLFRVLRAEKVRVIEVLDADKALIRAADRWIKESRRKRSEHETSNPYGCLVVVSEDTDFVELMTRARKQMNFVVVTATPNKIAQDQTRKLLEASDVVLGLEAEEEDGDFDVESVELYFDPLVAKAQTPKGEAFLERMEQTMYH